MNDSKLVIKAIGELKKNLITRIGQVETKLGTRINQVETKLGTRINQVETKLGTRINQVGDRVEKLGNKISDVETVLSAKIDDINLNIADLRKETKQGFVDINNRADLLGKQLNALDDDAPVGDDFTNLVKRVDKLEKYQNFVTA